MEEQEQLDQKLEPNQEPEESPENVINTEENVISNNPPTLTTITEKISVPTKPYTITTTNKKKDSETDKDKDTHSMWYDLSIISWFLFLCTGLNLFINNSNISKSINILINEGTGIPANSYYSLIIGFITMIGTIGFIIYFNNITFKKNNSILNGMLGDMTKFHFIPLLLVSLIFITLSEPTTKASYVFCLLFSLSAYGSLVFLYLKIEYEGEWYEIITIKKGVFSCLIALTLYTFFLSISFIGIRSEASEGFLKGCGIVFPILIGIGNVGFAFYFKDLLVLITNILIYVEMAKYGFFYDKGADGGIDILMILISTGVIFYLLFKEREAIYKCTNN